MITRLFPVINVDNAPFYQCILAKELEGKSYFYMIPAYQLKQHTSEVLPRWGENFFCLFICEQYCAKELVSSPGKLFARHHWGDNLTIHTDHSLWSAMTRVTPSCIISTKKEAGSVLALEILLSVGITPLGIHSSRFFLTKKWSSYS